MWRVSGTFRAFANSRHSGTRMRRQGTTVTARTNFKAILRKLEHHVSIHDMFSVHLNQCNPDEENAVELNFYNQIVYTQLKGTPTDSI